MNVYHLPKFSGLSPRQSYLTLWVLDAIKEIGYARKRMRREGVDPGETFTALNAKTGEIHCGKWYTIVDGLGKPPPSEGYKDASDVYVIGPGGHVDGWVRMAWVRLAELETLPEDRVPI